MATTSSGLYLIDSNPQPFLKDIEWPEQSEETKAKVKEFWRTQKIACLIAQKILRKRKIANETKNQ